MDPFPGRGADLLRMPLDLPRPASATFAGTSRSIRVRQAQGRSPAGTVQPGMSGHRLHGAASTAYAVLLNRYTGQDTVTVATTVLNRPASEESLEIVGCFVNTAALVIDVDGDLSFRELLTRTSPLSHDRCSPPGMRPYPDGRGELSTSGATRVTTRCSRPC